MSKLAIHFTRQAREDLRLARRWYEDKEAGLGRRFSREVGDAAQAAAERPTSFPIQYGRTRRVILRSFPWGVFFIPAADRVGVTGVIDLRTDPDKWGIRRLQ